MDDTTFVEHTLVEINVPEDSDLDIETALSAPEIDSEDTLNSLIPSVPQRQSLFFDESLPIYIVVRVPLENEAALKSRISRLAITVQAVAINDPTAPISSVPKDGAPQQDVIWSGKLDPSEEPIVVMEESAEAEDISTALLIWKLTAVLSRPRLRLTHPTISWKAVPHLNPAAQNLSSGDGRYLPSGVPLPMNLLASFADGPSLNGASPFLSAAHLSKPGATGKTDSTGPILLRELEKRPLRALPSLTSRIRFHQSHRLEDVPTMAASLELDVPSSATAQVELLSIDLKLNRGQVEMMAPEHSVKLPRLCNPREGIVWLYTFSPLRTFDDPIANALSSHLLEVFISARVHVSDRCKPMTDIKWRTTVDFSTAKNSVRKTLNPLGPAQQPSQPGSQLRPNSASNLLSPRKSQDVDQGAENFEFTVTFLPPKELIYVGEPFKWHVIVVNKRPIPVHLALTGIQKRRPQHSGKRHSHQSSTGSVTAVSKSGAIADAVIDDNLLYATVKAGGPETSNLICLSPDVKVGPLAPGAAGEAELEFLPLAKGWLQPEAIRLTDMATSEYTDIRQLPDIMALERETEVYERSRESKMKAPDGEASASSSSAVSSSEEQAGSSE